MAGRVPSGVGRAVLPAAIIVLSILWGVAFVAIKQGLRELSPDSLAILRFLIADAALIATMAIWPKARPRIERTHWWRIIVLGLTGVPAYHLPLNWAEQRTTASVAALIVATAPVMVAFVSPMLLRERLTARGALGIALAFGGVAILALQGEDSGHGTQLTGLLVATLAPLSWAAYTIVGKPLTERMPPIQITVASLLVGSAMLLPFVGARVVDEARALSAAGWWWTVWLGAGASAGGYLLFNFALMRMSAWKVSVAIYLVPVVALISAAILLDEPLGAMVGLAAALVIVGVFLAQRGGVEHEHDEMPLEHAGELRGG